MKKSRASRLGLKPVSQRPVTTAPARVSTHRNLYNEVWRDCSPQMSSRPFFSSFYPPKNTRCEISTPGEVLVRLQCTPTNNCGEDRPLKAWMNAIFELEMTNPLTI